MVAITSKGKIKKPVIYRKELLDGTKVTPKKPSKIAQRRVNSRAKGARGERAFAALLRNYGLGAYRGQQFRGGSDSPDVVCPDLPHVHFEVKNCVASTVFYEWVEQAIRDAEEGKLRVVAHRAKHHDWICILPVQDFMRLVLNGSGRELP